MEKHTEERLAAIVESSFDAIVSRDLSGIIVSWNGAAERMFGYTEHEAIGQSIFLIVPADKREEELEIQRRLKLGERIETFETFRRHQNGMRIPISITISPIKSQSGDLVGASSIARDISQTKESERRLQLLMREINHRVKNQYAVILSVIKQTAARSISVGEFEARIRERIMALSHSHDLLSHVDWAGVSLADLVEHQIKPFTSIRTVKASGPEIALGANAVLNLGMALHELIMNSIRFGATADRDVSVTWRVVHAGNGHDQMFELKWSEPSHDPKDILEQQNGFGSLALLRIVPSALSAEATWAADSSQIVWNLSAPLAHIKVKAD